MSLFGADIYTIGSDSLPSAGSWFIWEPGGHYEMNMAIRASWLRWPAVLLVSSCASCTGEVADGPGLSANGGALGNGGAGTGAVGGGPGSSFGVRPLGLDCGSGKVGLAPLKRLTRTQYTNAAHDLLGVADDVAKLLPADERLGAYRNNTVAPVGRLDIEQYGEVADRLATSAVARLDALLACDRSKLGDTECATQFIASFGRRSARRPLRTTEQTAYEGLFTRFGAADFATGIRLVVQAMLESPAFLYQPEFGVSGAASGPAVPLDPYEISARLALFLWDTVPDAPLLELAARDALATPEALHAQAESMLADPRAAHTIANFHTQWLGIDALDTVQKDAAQFPRFSAALAHDMQAETVRFATQTLLFGDGRLATLLTAPYSFPDGEVFAIYGATRPANYASDSPFQLNPHERAGILTQPSFLAAHAHPNQTSPVSRGVAVLSQLLCAPPSPPPPNVNTRPPDPAPGLSTRARFAVHESSPACAACHGVIDPIGFGFENYDAVGSYRSQEYGVDIDASGTLRARGDADGPYTGAVALAKKLAASDQVRECVARQWFQYVFARSAGDDDACSFWSSFDAFKAADYDVRALLTAFVVSDSFRFKQGSQP